MLRLIPLGGLGEFGLNAMVFESSGERLLVDCGLMFPGPELVGVDLVLPDFSYLRAAPERLKGVVLTHGHEDHVGALPFLLRDLPVPVYGTRLTLALVRHRLEEMGLEPDLREVSPGIPFRVGQAFEVEAVRVTHSIPDGVGLAVRTPEGTVIHTGDFKLDGAPIDGRVTDLERFGALGDEGVLCLLSDSTNSEREGPTGEEREVAQALDQHCATAAGRIILSLFASNLHRVQHALRLAERTGRKVALQGRAMVRNVELARTLGYLEVPDGLLIPLGEAHALAPQRVMLLSTGSQAEPRSGLLNLLAAHPSEGRIGAGDLVLLSSKPIPGNERSVGQLIDRLLESGAKVAYAGVDPKLHVSGHASRAEQRRMLEAVRPTHFIPVHGELRHLYQHLGVARAAGVANDRLLLAKDGDVVAFAEGRGTFAGQVPFGRVMTDRFSQAEVSPGAVEERGALRESGLVIVLVAINRANGRVESGPTLHARGLSDEELRLMPRLTEEVAASFLETSPAVRADDAFVKDALTRAVRASFKQRLGRRPNVLPLLVRL